MDFKYKAWDVTHGNDDVSQMFAHVYPLPNGKILIAPNGHVFQEADASDFILLEYVNLFDKNSQRYCQDDIVEYENKLYRVVKTPIKLELEGYDGDFFGTEDYKQGVVVGNMYEHPDLVNQMNKQ